MVYLSWINFNLFWNKSTTELIAHPTKSLHTALSHKVNETCVLKYYAGVQAVEDEKMLSQVSSQTLAAETDVKSNMAAKEKDEKTNQKVIQHLYGNIENFCLF